MRHVLICLAAAVLVSGGRTAPPDPARCTDEFVRLRDTIGEEVAKGDDAQAALIDRFDRLVARYGDPDSECAHRALHQVARVELIRGRSDRVLARTERFGEGPVHDAHPESDAMIYYARSVALESAGRQADAQGALAAAATMVPRLNATRAVYILSALASASHARNDWRVAEEAFERAEEVIRDSAAAYPDRLRLTLGSLLSKKTYLVLALLEEETDSNRQRAVARRLLAVADSAIAIHETTQGSPADRTYAQGYWAGTEIDAAYAEAVLGNHAAADRRLDAAYGLLSPQVVDLLDYLPSDYWLRRAWTEQEAGRLSAAVDAAQASMEACRTSLNLACAREADVQWADILEETGQWPEAETHYRAAVRLANLQWERERMQDWSTQVFASLQAPFRGLTRVLLHQGRTSEAFAALDGARARTLRDLRSWQAARAQLAPDRARRVDSLLAAVYDERSVLLTDTLRPDELSVVRSAIATLQQRIADETGLSASTQAPLDVPAVQTALQQQRRTLVSYLVDEDTTVVFVLTPDTLVARTLPVGAADIQGLMAEAGGAWGVAQPDPAVRLPPLATLYDRLVRPVAHLLPPGDGLVVIPDGPLADLPFGALLTGPPADDGPQPFLIRSRAVSTDLAAALVPYAPAPERAFDVDLLAFGRSQFGSDGGQFRSRSGPLLANLPNVATEIRQVEAYTGSRASALNAEATEARFAAQAGRARIVHIASHAEVDPGFPLNSKIYLWDDPEASDDGIVHLFELQSLALPADLVVLSGCSTAQGQANSGEGTVGLQYGVRAAGAQASVATLWPVDDRATGELINTFYAALADGLPVDRALQRAQVTYLDTHTGAAASPYFWAATVFSGRPDPIPLQAPMPVWWWAVGAAAVGGLAWVARRRLAHA